MWLWDEWIHSRCLRLWRRRDQIQAAHRRRWSVRWMPHMLRIKHACFPCTDVLKDSTLSLGAKLWLIQLFLSGLRTADWHHEVTTSFVWRSTIEIFYPAFYLLRCWNLGLFLPATRRTTTFSILFVEYFSMSELKFSWSVSAGTDFLGNLWWNIRINCASRVQFLNELLWWLRWRLACTEQSTWQLCDTEFRGSSWHLSFSCSKGSNFCLVHLLLMEACHLSRCGDDLWHEPICLCSLGAGHPTSTTSWLGRFTKPQLLPRCCSRFCSSCPEIRAIVASYFIYFLLFKSIHQLLLDFDQLSTFASLFGIIHSWRLHMCNSLPRFILAQHWSAISGKCALHIWLLVTQFHCCLANLCRIRN